MRPLKILAIASSGGHWIELLRLRPLFEENDTRFVTTRACDTPPSGEHPVTIVADAARDSPLRFVWAALSLLMVFGRFRPDVVITTGAGPGLVAMIIGRLFGAHTIWLDSIANTEEISMSGKLASGANLRLTQWPELAGTDGFVYFGTIL